MRRQKRPCEGIELVRPASLTELADTVGIMLERLGSTTAPRRVRRRRNVRMATVRRRRRVLAWCAWGMSNCALGAVALVGIRWCAGAGISPWQALLLYVIASQGWAVVATWWLEEQLKINKHM